MQAITELFQQVSYLSEGSLDTPEGILDTQHAGHHRAPSAKVVSYFPEGSLDTPEGILDTQHTGHHRAPSVKIVSYFPEGCLDTQQAKTGQAIYGDFHKGEGILETRFFCWIVLTDFEPNIFPVSSEAEGIE
jgi:hypothetical protein